MKNKKMINIVIICTGNICRSPMAEGLLKRMLPEELKGRVKVSSAGTHAGNGDRAMDYAIENMDGIGIDISSHRSRFLSSSIVENSDLMIVMVREHKDFILKKYKVLETKVRLLSEFKQKVKVEEIVDPFGGSLSDYNSSLNNIEDCISGLIMFLGEIL